MSGVMSAPCGTSLAAAAGFSCNAACAAGAASGSENSGFRALGVQCLVLKPKPTHASFSPPASAALAAAPEGMWRTPGSPKPYASFRRIASCACARVCTCMPVCMPRVCPSHIVRCVSACERERVCVCAHHDACPPLGLQDHGTLHHVQQQVLHIHHLLQAAAPQARLRCRDHRCKPKTWAQQAGGAERCRSIEKTRNPKDRRQTVFGTSEVTHAERQALGSIIKP